MNSWVNKHLAMKFKHHPLIRTGRKTDWDMQIWAKEFGESIGSVAFSSEGRLIAFACGESIRTWDTRTGLEVGEPFDGHKLLVRSIAYSPDNSRIVSGSKDESLRIWDTQTGKATGDPLRGHSGVITSVAYSPNGKYIASCSRDFTIRIWDSNTCKIVGEPLQGHMHVVTSVQFSPDSQSIVSGSVDGTLRVWKVPFGEAMGKTLDCGSGKVLSVAWSPDGQRVVASFSDTTLRIWSTHSGKALGNPLRGHHAEVYSAAYSPNGQYIASGSRDRTIRIWNAQTGAQIGPPLTGHNDGVLSVAFAPDNRYLLSGSYDGTVRIWDVEAVVTEAQSILENPDRSINQSWSNSRASIGSSHVANDVSVENAGNFFSDYFDDDSPGSEHDSEPLGMPISVACTDKILKLNADRKKWMKLCNEMDANDGWIKCEGKRLLWVPPGFRETRGLIETALSRKKTIPHETVVSGVNLKKLNLYLGKSWTRIYEP